MTTKKNIKNYLSRAERDNFLLSMTTVHHNEKLLATWGDNLTSDEKRRLKSSNTNTEKALSSIIKRMPVSEAKKIMKHSQDFEVRILSMEGAKALENNTFKKFVKDIPFTFEDMMFVSSYILESSCCNCNRSYNDCRFYKMFEKWLTPGANALENCPYAYNATCELNCNKKGEEGLYETLQTYASLKARDNKIIQKFNDGELIHKKDIKKYLEKNEEKISKRKKKKLENRYDKEDDVYVYTTKKGEK